jgi:hypothetical protein
MFAFCVDFQKLDARAAKIRKIENNEGFCKLLKGDNM